MTDASVLAALGGRRILVVEDEFMIAALWETALTEAGGMVLGPFPRVDPALGCVAQEPALDAAVLDINLRGQSVLPVAEALAARRVPFLFATGYGTDGVPADFRNRMVLTKPCPVRRLLAAVSELVARSTA